MPGTAMVGPPGPRIAACEGAYAAAGALTGPIRGLPSGGVDVRFRAAVTRGERATLAAFAVVGVVLPVTLSTVLLHAAADVLRAGGTGPTGRIGVVAVAALAVLCELARSTQLLGLCWFAWHARDPVPVPPPAGLRVAMLTTIVPSREPVTMVARTLAAMRGVHHDGPVDVWLLDEGDDPEVRRACADLGVRHFSRRGRAAFNRPSGPYRAGTKAGNHNAWRAGHERDYDVVAQMDPDHVPGPAFLERTLGYFRDPDVAFVVAPQVYGNAGDSFVSRAAASLAHVFHGVVQRGGNTHGAPLLIGTNHLYRTTAWAQVDGYQDSVIEDHLTSMRVHATRNPATGGRWKGVYTPDVVAIGEGPATWTDLFNQQRRWSYGVWEILLRHTAGTLRRLAPAQRVVYVLLQSFYPVVGLLWVAGVVLGLAAVVLDAGGAAPASRPVAAGALWWAATATQLALIAWLRRFNLAPHERADRGWRAVLLTLVTAPVYAAAAASALCRRPLRYIVTGKGSLRSRDSWATFRTHGRWAALIGTAALALAATGRPASLSVVLPALLLTALPPGLHAVVHRLRAPRA